MTDTELIAALGWKACQWFEFRVAFSHEMHWRCRRHDSIRYGPPHPQSCEVMRERLGYVRAGIDLAREQASHCAR